MKTELTEDKRTKIEKLIEKDFKRGPKFMRDEIELMMRDRNFASTYADKEKYKAIPTGGLAGLTVYE